MENDNAKTIAIVSYITFIGWLIAFIMHSNDQNKSSLAGFHLRQALGIFLTGVASWIVIIIMMFIPFLGWLINLALALGLIAIWIMGLIAAVNGEEKPVPVVGNFYQDLLKGIK